jgi:cytochrome c biogenesis protein
MTTNTAGMLIRTRQRWLVDAIELISSMRFAISLLSLLAIASVIGTVLKQNEPMPNYVNQFGAFWFAVFDKFDLYSVYASWWFLLILGFLVLSTALCITRNAPKMLKDMRSWRENVREQSLRNFHHHQEWESALSCPQLVTQLSACIVDNGYKVKQVIKHQATLITAKRGAANKWGYIFAHSAIVVICIGGLLDSDLPIRFQKWFCDKTPFTGAGVIAQIPSQHRLGLGNPTFRGNTLIPEGASSSTAMIQQKNGVLIQDLPFTITLQKFVIDYYSTGMPKLFASEVLITDHDSGKSFPATIKVNEPLIYKGLAVYQSSFEDGGSKLQLTGYPLQDPQLKRFSLNAEVNTATPLKITPERTYTVEVTGFRPFNVENLNSNPTSDANDTNGQDARAVKLNRGFSQTVKDGLEKRLGNAAKNAHNKQLHNVGPSVQYKLRDKNGQAREYHTYMQPVQVDGDYVFLAGVRDTPDSPFRYLRIPADDQDSVDEWMRLRFAMMDPQLRLAAAQRYAQHAISNVDSASVLRQQLTDSAEKGLRIFAGNDRSAGYSAVSDFLSRIPLSEQQKAADIFMKILNGSMWDLWQLVRERDQLNPVPIDEKHARFLQLATNAYSDAFFYNAPVYLQLKGFQEIKASVLQVTRSPGKNIVYLGCLLLVMGIFSMLYIRERRLWIWLTPSSDGKSRVLMAMSSQRKTLDFENEFIELTRKLGSTPIS